MRQADLDPPSDFNVEHVHHARSPTGWTHICGVLYAHLPHLPYPLAPVSATDSMIWRWKIKKTTRIGISETKLAPMISA